MLIATFMSIPILTACSIRQKDELECGLSDGSKFILTSEYDWYPLAMFMRSAAERARQDYWRITYLDNRKSIKTAAPVAIAYSGSKFIDQLRSTCLQVGKKNKTPITKMIFMGTNSKWLPKTTIPPENIIPYVPQDRNPSIQAALQKSNFRGTTFNLSFTIPKDGRLFHEQPLYRTGGGGYYGKQIIEGVYQSVSIDEGLTWSSPIITTNAEIFEMGKSWLDQCFIARPIKINGTRIEPDFPASCQPIE